jgi:hypothetical protein
MRRHKKRQKSLQRLSKPRQTQVAARPSVTPSLNDKTSSKAVVRDAIITSLFGTVIGGALVGAIIIPYLTDLYKQHFGPQKILTYTAPPSTNKIRRAADSSSGSIKSEFEYTVRIENTSDEPVRDIEFSVTAPNDVELSSPKIEIEKGDRALVSPSESKGANEGNRLWKLKYLGTKEAIIINYIGSSAVRVLPISNLQVSFAPNGYTPRRSVQSRWNASHAGVLAADFEADNVRTAETCSGKHFASVQFVGFTSDGNTQYAPAQRGGGDFAANPGAQSAFDNKKRETPPASETTAYTYAHGDEGFLQAAYNSPNRLASVGGTGVQDFTFSAAGSFNPAGIWNLTPSVGPGTDADINASLYGSRHQRISPVIGIPVYHYDLAVIPTEPKYVGATVDYDFDPIGRMIVNARPLAGGTSSMAYASFGRVNTSFALADNVPFRTETPDDNAEAITYGVRNQLTNTAANHLQLGPPYTYDSEGNSTGSVSPDVYDAFWNYSLEGPAFADYVHLSMALLSPGEEELVYFPLDGSLDTPRVAVDTGQPIASTAGCGTGLNPIVQDLRMPGRDFGAPLAARDCVHTLGRYGESDFIGLSLIRCGDAWINSSSPIGIGGNGSPRVDTAQTQASDMVSYDNSSALPLDVTHIKHKSGALSVTSTAMPLDGQSSEVGFPDPLAVYLKQGDPSRLFIMSTANSFISKF